MALRVYPLGQSGFLFQHPDTRVAIDPYLTDSVADRFGGHLKRLVQPTIPSGGFTDIDWVLITHAHLDHADPESIRLILSASPNARFVCPYEVDSILLEAGVGRTQIIRAPTNDMVVAQALRIRSIPAAHTGLERNGSGELRYVGYLLQWDDCTIYHSGDTIPHPEIFAALGGVAIDYAFLPVNERNYFRDEAGIVGNMSVREAFEMATRLHAKTLVPMHWDLFDANSTFPEEMEFLHSKLAPPFALRFLPCGREHELTTS